MPELTDTANGNSENKELSPLERAAVLMVALEAETPGITNSIFAHMGEEKSKLMLKTIAGLGRVGSDVVNQVVDEFFSIAIENKYIFGGEEVSSKILQDTFGVSPQDDFFSDRINLFEFINKVRDEELLKFFKSENSQCIALILNYMETDRLSQILSLMDIERAKEVSQLLIEISIPNMHLVWDFQQTVEDLLSLKKNNEKASEDIQVTKMARALEMTAPDVRQEIFGLLEDQNKKALDKLKGLIFTFKELENISDKDLETILYEVTELRSLAIALSDCSESMLQKVQDNISDRVKIMLDEETAALPDALKTEDIEKAQREILKVARKLEREHKIERLLTKPANAEQQS